MSSSEMPLNVPTVSTDLAHIHVTNTRTSESTVHSIYRYPPSNEIVLEFTVDLSIETMQFNRIDKVFWTIMVDGLPTTERELQDFSQFNGMEAHPETRILNLSRKQATV